MSQEFNFTPEMEELAKTLAFQAETAGEDSLTFFLARRGRNINGQIPNEEKSYRAYCISLGDYTETADKLYSLAKQENSGLFSLPEESGFADAEDRRRGADNTLKSLLNKFVANVGTKHGKTYEPDTQFYEITESRGY